jgi:hypothetical protein
MLGVMAGQGQKTPYPAALARKQEEEPESETHRAPTARRIAATAPFFARVPKVVLSRAELNAADLDHREYFLISMLDGATTVENLLDICGMPAEEALALLDGLMGRGIIVFEG